MLEKFDLNSELPKKEFHVMKEELEAKFALLQRRLREYGIPVAIIFEGWGASGKGTLINQLISPLDPRGFKVYTTKKPSKEEKMRPFLWRFWTRTPAKGRIHVFDRSWYQRVMAERMDKLTRKSQIQYAYSEIVNFEEQLTNDGMVLIKFFLHISREEQRKRFKKLEQSPETKWRVTKKDWRHNKDYDAYLTIMDEALVKTDTDFAPWTIVDATNREYAAIKILAAAVERLDGVLQTKEKEMVREEPLAEIRDTGHQQLKNGVLNGVDLSLSMDKTEYKETLKKLQNKLAVLHNEMYRKRLPVILAFEGWDAAGKGGAIKRITEKIDPRGYEVIPTASPNDIEKAHHYLWRFWNNIPKSGHMAIFDRTWYGRVMVERIEGFCDEKEWKRAYNEINHMEEHLSNAGYVILKFWLHIDQEEQERRFRERQDNPEKQWKITEEDWRNREKWPAYEEAVDEMIVRTSTQYAPWVIVEANSKYYARIKVLETIVQVLEDRLCAPHKN